MTSQYIADKFSDFMGSIDLFSVPVKFYVIKQPSYSNWCGKMASLTVYIFMIYTFTVLTIDSYQGTNPNIVDEMTVDFSQEVLS
jgi:hypothetical protein